MTDSPTDDDRFRRKREALVERLRDRGYIETDRTADAMRAVPRHEFVPSAKRDQAYEDRPLPIADGQTISAPHMVAMMADLLDLQPGDRVLEIGTGCGYHAAVTAETAGADAVYSVEFSESLVETARDRLARTGYGAVTVVHGDGATGLPEYAPYDAAYLTCAAGSLPDPIVHQVSTGGYILAPIGRFGQTLYRYTVGEDGTVDRESHGGVRFVSMRGNGP